MLFNSWSFLFLFLPTFLLVWQSVASIHPRTLIYVLISFSLGFYVIWSGPYLLLLLAIISTNLGFAHILLWQRKCWPDSTKYGKIILVVAIVINLLPLIWFKYSSFLVQNIALMLNAQWHFLPPDLPLGISFYTFIQIAWLVAVYRSETKPLSYSEHLAYSCAFPYIISGPIVRPQQLMWQITSLQPLSASGLAQGFTLFAFGLGKKVLIADSIGYYADMVFNAAQKNWPLSGCDAWLGSFCYTFQLYFDFSGYTDMALGLGLMVGLRLPENFNSPYKATGIVDFWRRWHITLSSWLRDFLYIPLGGNRHGKLRQYRNLFLTMLIGGAWHGAGWTFLIWGTLHGVMLCLNHFFRVKMREHAMERYLANPVVRIGAIAVTFFYINFCWVIFRSPDLNAAAAMYGAMFTGNFDVTNYQITTWQPFALLTISAIICWLCPTTQQILQGNCRFIIWRPTPAWAIAMATLVFLSLTLLSRQSTFLYFQF